MTRILIALALAAVASAALGVGVLYWLGPAAVLERVCRRFGWQPLADPEITAATGLRPPPARPAEQAASPGWVPPTQRVIHRAPAEGAPPWETGPAGPAATRQVPRRRQS